MTTSTAQTLERAVDAHRRGDLSGAGRLYRGALAVDPRCAAAWHLLGVAALQQGRAENAAILIGRALRLTRREAAFFGNFALALATAGAGAGNGAGGRGRALAAYRAALALQPDYGQAFNNYGAALRDGGDDAAAAVCYRRALAVDPNHVDALENLGVALQACGPGQEACAALGRAAALNGGRPDTLAKLGDGLALIGRPAAALDSYRRALAAVPDHLNARLGEIKALAALDRVAEAGERCFELLAPAERAGDADAALQVGALLFEWRREADAAAVYRRFAAFNPDRRRYPGDGAQAAAIRPAAAVCGERGWPYRRLAPPRRHTVATRSGVSETYDLPETFIARVDDAVVVPGNQTVLTGNALLLDGLNPYSRASLKMVPRFIHHAADDRVLLDLPDDDGRSWNEEEAALLGGGGNFSHNLNDWLSRLAVLERAPELDGLPLLLAADASPTMVELTRLLGVDPARLVRAAPGRIERRRRLWVPSLTHHFQHAAPEHVEFVRRRLAPLLTEGRAAAPPRRLYLTRRNAGYRAVVNEAAVVGALAPLGVEMATPEDFSITEQIRLFAAAELIIGPVGGGSAAIMFAPPGAAVLELTHDRCVLPQYPILAALLGQRFARIVGRRTENRGPLAFDWDFFVPPERAAAAARALLDGRDADTA